MKLRSCIVSAGLAMVCVLQASHAQSCPNFLPGGPADPGISDNFSAYVQPMLATQGKVFFAGAFSIAGTVTTNCIAAYDPNADTWSTLSGGIDLGNTNGFGAALAEYTIEGTTRVILGGGFAGARNGGSTVPDSRGIAAWDGTQWSSMGSGWTNLVGGSVWTLLRWPQPNGTVRLVAGGGWDNIGSATSNGIAFFDGTSWNNIAGPTDAGIAGPQGSSPTVFASAIFNNQLFIGGRFTSANGFATPLVARWNGTTWSRPGSLSADGTFSDVSSMHVWNDGTGDKLYVGGFGVRVGGQATTIASWNGTIWQRVGQNLGGRGTALANFDDGTGDRLYMGMTADGQQRYLYRLEGTTWTPVSNGVSVALTGNFPSVFGLRVIDDVLYVGGNFQLANGIASAGIARYAGCQGPQCDGIDFNNDGNVFDPTDIDAFLSVYSEGPCIPALNTCNDIDFNNDGASFDPDDIDSFLSVYSEGPCL